MKHKFTIVSAVKRIFKRVLFWSINKRRRIRVAGHILDGDGVVTIMHSDYRWRKVRNAHVRKEPFCRMCGLRRKLEVHHIVPWHLSPELRYTPSNLITLDRECHFRFGHLLDWKDLNPNIRELCEKARDLNPNIEKVGL